jgi:hydrogenase maturation protease
MKNKKIVLLGIGNVLQKDDGIGVYAATYLSKNYTFSPSIDIINGGVEGINLLNIFIENDDIIILDTISIEDKPATIYNIPSHELGGYGLNSGSAHEIGVLQCLDMLDLQEIPRPKSNIIAIIPSDITFEFNLSHTLKEEFEDYIKVILSDLEKREITFEKTANISIENIIDSFKDPSSILNLGKAHL